MINPRSLASITLALAVATLVPASAQQTQSPVSAPDKHRETLQLYCVGCHSGPDAVCRTEPASRWTSPISRTMAPSGRSCCASCATARCRRPACRGPTPATYEALVKYHRDRTRSPGGGQAQSRTPHAPSPQPDRIRQRHSRFAGARDRRCGAAAGRRHRLRLRQHRRRADRIAGVAGTLSFGGRQDQPAGRGRYHDAGVLSDLYRSARAHSGRSHERRRCRSARAAAPSFATASRWTANMRFRSTCNGAGSMSILGWSGNASSICGSTIKGSNCSPLRPIGERQNAVLGGGTTPDAHLKVRVPVKAGTQTIVATFLKDTVMPEGILAQSPRRQVQAYFEGVGSISVAGPYNVQGPGATPSRDKIFICHPAARAEEAGLRGKDPRQPRAPRLSAAGHVRTICRNCSRSTGKAPRAAASRRA